MSPIEQIKDGIVKGDWNVVCDGYAGLTGERLTTPSSLDRDALYQISAIVSETLGCCETTTECRESEPTPATTTGKKTKQAKKTKKKTSKKKTKRQTVDKDGNDASIQLDDAKKTVVSKATDGVRLITNEPDPDEIEKNRLKAEKAKKNKLQLGRTGAKTHKVKCNECGNQFDSHRPDGELGQKCNGCLSSKKGRRS